MDYSIPGFPVHHQLLELTQTHGYKVTAESGSCDKSYYYGDLQGVDKEEITVRRNLSTRWAGEGERKQEHMYLGTG